LSDANDVCLPGAADAGADVEVATEVAATANPTVRAKSRRVITLDMLAGLKWNLQVQSQPIARLTWPAIKSYICRVTSVASLMML